MSALHNLTRANNCVLLEKILDNYYKNNKNNLNKKDSKINGNKVDEAKLESDEKSEEQPTANNTESNESNLNRNTNVHKIFFKPRKTVEDLSVAEHNETKNELDNKVNDKNSNKNKYKLDSSFIDKRDSFNRTPLHLACYEGHLEAAKLLIKFGANVQSQAKSGMTCLHFASQKGHLEIVELLIKHGSKINTQTNNCMTPLHFAISNQHLDCAVLLINNGAKQKYNKKGELPLDMASEDFKNKLKDSLKDKFNTFENDIPQKRKIHKETVKFYKKRKNE